MNYRELLRLGFKRNDCLSDDSVYLDIHGFRCFWLEMYFEKNICIEWSPIDGKIELITYKIKHLGNVKSRREINEGEMLDLVNIFSRCGDLDKTNNYINAC